MHHAKREAATAAMLDYRAGLILRPMPSIPADMDYDRSGPDGQVIEFFNARTGETIKRGKLREGESWHSCYRRLTAPKPWFSLRKVGGIWHWRIGRLGGSFYIGKGA